MQTLDRPIVPRTHLLGVRMTPAEIQALRDVAWAQGLNMSSFVRQITLAAIRNESAA
jgi:hypothetical protein